METVSAVKSDLFALLKPQSQQQTLVGLRQGDGRVSGESNPPRRKGLQYSWGVPNKIRQPVHTSVSIAVDASPSDMGISSKLLRVPLSMCADSQGPPDT